jgi:hypothetical protein
MLSLELATDPIVSVPVIGVSFTNVSGGRLTLDRLKLLFMDRSPVENPSKIPVQPKLVCEVALRGMERKTISNLRCTSGTPLRERELVGTAAEKPYR